MGFEPFIPPRRPVEKAPEGSRDEKVINLAKLLHARGITSSMTDAKRLAEGMVDVERKVVKQESKILAAHNEHADIASSAAHATHHSTLSLDLPPAFAQFVAQAAALTHTSTPVEIPVARKENMSYGRESPKPVAEVPHIMPHKQVFFQEAPPLSATRGFREEAPKVSEILERRSEFTRVEETADGVALTRAQEYPDTVVVEERVIIKEEEPEERAVPKEEIKEEPRAPIKEEPKRPTEDLAKAHGVDLFEFFKKK